jgi:aminoglycoside/choline kinase family phosphotransferase
MHNRAEIQRVLIANNLFPFESWQISKLAGDGSDRLFYRLTNEQTASLIIVFPGNSNPKGLQEARAAFLLGRHFHSKGISVPDILGFSGESGAIIFADLGNEHLQTRIKCQPDQLITCYEKTIDSLIDLQLKGRNDFPQAACWDTLRYDRQLMLERESGYFYKEFCRGLLGLAENTKLDSEFQKLADLAADQPAGFVLHRDFQSRNIMMHRDRAVIIDFQGARLGPLAYDLASLLLDPYAGLGTDQQQYLREYYLTRISKLIKINFNDFLSGYYYLALQRNLQILGAFAFLSQKKGKIFFKQYINPAVVSLADLLCQPAGRSFPQLRKLVEIIRNKLNRQNQ